VTLNQQEVDAITKALGDNTYSQAELATITRVETKAGNAAQIAADIAGDTGSGITLDLTP
jgi:hypothetical protein